MTTMGILYYIALGIGLSIDSFTASVTTGVCTTKTNFRYILKTAFFMGFFQSLMPLLGWFLGVRFQTYIESFDHWIAFALLGYLGFSMVRSSFKKEESDKSKYCPSNTKMLAMMAIATSIDAMAVGISLGLLKVSIALPVIIIGIITFIFSVVGVWFGKKIGSRYNSGLERFAGIILFGLGLKILIEHTFFA